MAITSFVIEQKPFLALIASMQPICTKRNSVNATNFLLFHIGHRELIIKSTDLEISLQVSYPLKEGNVVDNTISFLVSGRRLFELVKELDGDIFCEIDERILTLKNGSVSLTLNINSPEDFPPFPERIENLMMLKKEFLLTLLSKVSFLIPQNNVNHALNGMFIEISPTKTVMTATDGHCLAQVSSSEYTLDANRSWLLPRRAVFEIKKILESGIQDEQILLGICDNQLVFSGESFNFFSRLLNDPFPKYEEILDKKGFMPAYVDRLPLTKTLRRSSCLLSGQFIATQFSFGTQSIQVTMQNKEVGTLSEDIPLSDFKGENLSIRFYAPYLLSGLHVFPQEKLNFYLKNASSPIMFEAKEENYYFLYLVMPVAPVHG